jgi:glycerol-3-phosphate dehydrogenase
LTNFFLTRYDALPLIETLSKLIGSKPERIEIDNYIKNNTIEGYYTLESIYQLLKDKRVSIPIIDLIYEIIVEGKDPELLLMFLIIKS